MSTHEEADYSEESDGVWNILEEEDYGARNISNPRMASRKMKPWETVGPNDAARKSIEKKLKATKNYKSAGEALMARMGERDKGYNEYESAEDDNEHYDDVEEVEESNDRVSRLIIADAGIDGDLNPTVLKESIRNIQVAARSINSTTKAQQGCGCAIC
mmetsp:Transcript_17483/g.21523  ORF Transcript_17483/g.21523 Transcript_17483/m.21523 type:complete len:159 (-) Transcript_17483:564-1040(-)|eukprot:CAMPEP_0204829274 /NCGR_PEP_ID=MMETSP1346-20131115/7376_1 /ASSEMBLY_ACC=CAM_ASM_000771 /TAXON_ID=215587 /ORGANISM="Aplanochytrium stocchinoi, Strain GSBS06" /LENGTH=158 /DNA_ID=CAMNT_0051958927 /DNA_START=220 /DNA_END=696 /DNA_ORIENTATION=-